MKLERVRLLNMKAAHNMDSFGLELNENRSDCVVNAEVQTVDGLFVITERRWAPESKILYLTLKRTGSNRRWRRQKKIKERIIKARK